MPEIDLSRKQPTLMIVDLPKMYSLKVNQGVVVIASLVDFAGGTACTKLLPWFGEGEPNYDIHLWVWERGKNSVNRKIEITKWETIVLFEEGEERTSHVVARPGKEPEVRTRKLPPRLVVSDGFSLDNRGDLVLRDKAGKRIIKESVIDA